MIKSAIWLLILLLEAISFGIGVELTVTPSPVIEGGSVNLTCSVTENTSVYASFNHEDGTFIGAVQLSGGQCIDGTGQTCTQECFCTTDGKSFSLIISGVPRSWDKVRVRCQVSNPTSTNSDYFSVSVIYPPEGTLTITPSGTQSVLTGTPVILQCQIRGGNPLATLTWQCKGSTVAGQDLTNDTTAVSSLTFTVDRTYHQQQCVCTARHQASPDGQFGTASVGFNVIYPPEGTLTVTPPHTQSVLTGTPVTLLCQVRGGNPLATLTWQCKGSTVAGQDLTNDTTAVSSLTFTVDRRFHQQQCVCTAGHQASPDGQFGTVSVGFNVIYPPTGTLTITPSGIQSFLTGTPVTIQCQVRGGNPLATLTWQCKGSTVAGQDMTKYTTAMSSLTFTVDRTFHQQQCVCTAGHQASPDGQFGIVSVRFDINSTPDIFISPLEDPYITRENQTGVRFTCAATSTNPPVTSIVWMKGSTTVSTTGVYSLPTITQDLAGVYTCSASNDVGTATANITLEVLSKPHMPHLLGITDVTSSSVNIKWAVYDLSSLSVNITYVCFNCAVLKWINVDLNDNGNTHVTTLTGLLSGTLYNLTITSENMAGVSDPLRIIISTSKSYEDIPADSFGDTSKSSWGLLVVAVAVILIGLTASGIGIFMYCKARLVGRSAKPLEQVVKMDSFSNEVHMENEAAEGSSHYQELRQDDIGKPSIYDCPSPVNRTMASRAESHQGSRQSNQESPQNEYSNTIDQSG